MRAKKRVFNDVVAEQIVDGGMNLNNNGTGKGESAVSASLNELLPADWRPKLDADAGAGPSGMGAGPSHPQPQPNPLHQPPQPQPNLDDRLLHEAPPLSAAVETTPTRPATTPRSRRFGVSGASGGNGRRVSSSTQKCIKFTQEPPPNKNQTILKYFSKKN